MKNNEIVIRRELQKCAVKQCFLYDEDTTWNGVWKRAEKRVWDRGALIATIGICVGLFILLLIGSAGVFAVVENPLLKILAGFIEAWIIIGIAISIALLYVKAAMPKYVAPLYDTYLRKHRERMKIARRISELENEFRKVVKETLRKEEKES